MLTPDRYDDQIKALEETIANLEEYKEALSEQLADPLTYQDEETSKEKVAEFKRVEDELPQLYAQWEELCILLEES